MKKVITVIGYFGIVGSLIFLLEVLMKLTTGNSDYMFFYMTTGYPKPYWQIIIRLLFAIIMLYGFWGFARVEKRSWYVISSILLANSIIFLVMAIFGNLREGIINLYLASGLVTLMFTDEVKQVFNINKNPYFPVSGNIAVAVTSFFVSLVVLLTW